MICSMALGTRINIEIEIRIILFFPKENLICLAAHLSFSEELKRSFVFTFLHHFIDVKMFFFFSPLCFIICFITGLF